MVRILEQEQIELVMHFAAFAYVGESVSDPLKYYENNFVASLRLLKAMLKVGVQFVFSSTCATYGVPASLPIVERATAADQPLWADKVGLRKLSAIIGAGAWTEFCLFPILMLLERLRMAVLGRP